MLPSQSPYAMAAPAFSFSAPQTAAATAATAFSPPPLSLPPVVPRHHDWDSDLFALGNEEREANAKWFKYGTTTTSTTSATTGPWMASTGSATAESKEQEEDLDIYCSLDGCHESFSSLSAFDAHYSCRHIFECSICGLKLPNNRLLEMHISERHDELFRILASKKRMWACLVEGCPQKSNSRRGRQLHLVDKHAYPPNYVYDRQIRRSASSSSKTRARHKDKQPTRLDAAMSDQAHFALASPSSSSSSSSSAVRSPEPVTTAQIAAQAAGSNAAAASAAAPARAAMVPRGNILAFTPRSVRNAAIAKPASSASAAASATLPAYDSRLASSAVPVSSAVAAALRSASTPLPPQFTTMRDSQPPGGGGMSDDEEDDDARDSVPRRAALGPSKAAHGSAASASSSSSSANKENHALFANDGNDDDDDDATSVAASSGNMGDVETDDGSSVLLSRLAVHSTSTPKKCSFGGHNRRHA